MRKQMGKQTYLEKGNKMYDIFCRQLLFSLKIVFKLIEDFYLTWSFPQNLISWKSWIAIWAKFDNATFTNSFLEVPTYMKFSWIANIWREREKLGWNCSGQKEPQRRAPTDGKVHLEVTTNNSHIRIHPYWWGRVALRTNVNLIWWNFLIWTYMTNKNTSTTKLQLNLKCFWEGPQCAIQRLKNSHFYSHFGWERFQQHFPLGLSLI